MTESILLYGAAAVITAAAFFFQRLTGFGSAILATPLLSLFWIPHAAINLLLIYQVVFAIMLIGSTWRSLLWPKLKVFMFSFIPALIAGAYILPALSAEMVRISIAFVVFTALLQWIFVPHWKVGKSWVVPAAIFFGILSGGIQGAFGTGGPFFLLYYGSVEKRSERIRDGSIAVFFVGNLLRLPVAVQTAQITTNVLWAAAFTLPLFIIAMLAGARVSRRLDDRYFRYAVIAILLVAAINLLV